MSLTCLRRGGLRRILSFLAFMLITPQLAAQQFPGGFIENDTSSVIRPLLSRTEILNLLPQRGKFTFPAPYNTDAIRLTNADDCGGADCLDYVGYSYWRNINNHVGSDTMLIFLGLNRAKGGDGPTLFQYNKVTDELTKVGPLFDNSSKFSWATGEGWYFSATLPHKLYMNDGSKMLRYDVITKTFDTVVDIADKLGSGYYIWQMHSSNDDNVHSFTVRDSNTYEMLGCAAYREDTDQFYYYPRKGDYDECQIDRSGRWLLIKENIDGLDGEDNRIIDLDTGVERTLLDRDGAGGHSDMGFGYMVAADNWANDANSIKVWDFAASTLNGTLSYHNLNWGVFAPAHVSHTNARPDVAPDRQYACGSSVNRTQSTEANEIICFKLDTSGDVLVVAPVMTDLDAAGGGSSDYAKEPKGNLDVTGKYFIWSSNMGGNRLDAFLVKVPADKLITGSADTTPPAVSITAPVDGAGVTGSLSILADASDDTGVAGVQFRLDGADLGSEDTSAPYSLTWDTTGASAGSHTLTAVARDAAGNVTTSDPVTVSVGGDTTAPVISEISAQVVTGTDATVVWNTDEAADSRVEYGLSSAYGSSSTLDLTLLTAHSAILAGLTPGTVYHYRVESRDAAGNLAVSGDHSLTTTSALDTTAPTVSMTSPAGGAKVSGSITISADAADDTGVAGVQFRLDGADLGAEDTAAPYSVTWNSSGLRGSHNLTAVARDAAGNTATSAAITVNVKNDATPPQLSAENAINVTASGAEIDWTTDEPADSAVEYGTSSAYGSSTALDTALVTGHAVTVSGLSANTTYHYRVLSRDSAGNLAGSGDYTFTTAQSGTAVQADPAVNVTWTDLVNVTADGGSLQKTAGCDGCADAGAASQQQIPGDGYLEFTVNETDLLRYAGLTSHHSGTGAGEIDFALRLQAGTAEVRENGTWRADTPVSAGDVFRIAVRNGVVTYAKNGTVFYTSNAAPASPLRADTSFNAMNSTVIDAVMGGTSALLAHWQLDDGNGGTALDATGNGHDGTLVNGPVWSSGVDGGALSLDGVDDYVDIPHTPSLNSYPLSVSLWVKTGSVSGLHGLVNKYYPGSFNGYQVFMNNGNLCAWYFRDDADYVWDGSGCTLSTPGIADNQWHHVVFTVDGNGGRLYVDGVQTASRAWTGNPGPATTTQPLSLGRYPGTAAPYLPGTLDDVRVYSRALDATEVSTLYAAVQHAAAVTWTDLVNVAADGGSLQKTAGCDGCADAGAASQQQIPGDGYLEFTVNETDLLRYAGLTSHHSGTGAGEIDFALRLQSGTAEVRENGTWRADTPVSAGDVFRIAVRNGVVTYAKNGTVFYTSNAAPASPLRADTSFNAMNSTVTDAIIMAGN